MTVFSDFTRRPSEIQHANRRGTISPADVPPRPRRVNESIVPTSHARAPPSRRARAAVASNDRTVDASTESARAHAFCGGDDDGGGDDALGRLRREHGAMYARMRSMLDEDARGAGTRRRLRRALVEEFPEFDAYAIDVAVAWDDARCATLARGLVETPTAEFTFGAVYQAAEKGLKERLKFLYEH